MKTELRLKYIKALNNSKAKGLMSEVEYNKEIKDMILKGSIIEGIVKLNNEL